MWSGYSTRDAAEFVGLTQSAIRSCVRARVLTGDSARLRFSFQDLLVLKVVKQLTSGGIPLSRVRSELAALRRRRGAESSLSDLCVESEAGHVVVRDEQSRWRADSGQLLFPFDLTPSGAEIAEMPVRHEAPGPEPTPSLTADEWFERGLALEEDDPDAAIAAYRRAAALRSDSSETFINLGRLLAETGEVEEAETCFRRALDRDPNDSTAVYNLGVVAQDLGRDAEAIEYYCRALDLEPVLAEAHYNLATIYDRSGNARAAIRHINEYRKLTRGTPF